VNYHGIKALEGREAQESLLIFNDHLLQAQVPTKRKSGKNTMRPAWMNKEFLDESKHERKPTEGGSKDR